MSNIVNIDTKKGDFSLKVEIKLVSGINCLFGPSGAGKTSIINCIAGLEKAKKSLIVIKNKTLVDTKRNYFEKVHKRRIGYVFQDPMLFPHLNVRQNLMYGFNLNRKKNIFFVQDEIINLLSLNKLLSRYPYNLSGGEKQRVAIGRALLSQPELILMDEPLSSLDQNKKNELIAYLSKINDILKIPALYVSHSISETFRLGNKINYIKEGKLIFSGDRQSALNFYNKNDNSLFKDSYIKGKVIQVNKEESLSEIKLNKERLIVFSNRLKLNQQVIVKIKSSDIIISKVIPEQISSLNYIKAEILDVINQKDLVCLVLKFGDNLLKAHLTYKSYLKLKIAKGMRCYAIIKALNINDIIDISLV